MLVLLIICTLLMSCYAALMLLYRMGWERQQGFLIKAQYEPKTKISIIIPARNEEQNITTCLQAILSQNYPEHLWEVIVVDDHSTDDTKAAVLNIKDKRVRYIHLSDYVKEEITAYKKHAIAAGISVSNGTLIVTTDADCTMGKEWLRQIAAKYEYYKPVMIVSPVDYLSENKFLDIFQSLDFMSMQGITAATHALGMGNMCNGANLAFTKEAFYAVKGYDDIDHLASGDDYLLMVKMQKAFKGHISYLRSKEAIVYTQPQPDLKSFLQQRIRWASKSGKYDDKVMTTTLSFVYLFNLSFLILAIGSLFNAQSILFSGGLLMVKIIAEMIMLYPVAKFFGKRAQLFWFPIMQPFHIAYIIVAGLMGFAGVYSWKGRRVK